MKGQALKDFWIEVKEGIRPAPSRSRSGLVQRKINTPLDGSFGPDSDKRLVVTLHPNGRLELRPERSRRSESIMIDSVYRFAIRARVNSEARAKAKAKTEARAQRLADLRQERAERRLAQ